MIRLEQAALAIGFMVATFGPFGSSSVVAKPTNKDRIIKGFLREMDKGNKLLNAKGVRIGVRLGPNRTPVDPKKVTYDPATGEYSVIVPGTLIEETEQEVELQIQAEGRVAAVLQQLSLAVNQNIDVALRKATTCRRVCPMRLCRQRRCCHFGRRRCR